MATKEMTLEETSIFRLELLADLLEKLPKGRFDYTNWVGDFWKGKEDLSCGTTACALGWATTIPELRKLGLRMAKRGGNGTVILKRQDPGEESGPLMAAMTVFNINQIDAMWLFYPNDHNPEFREDSPGERAGSKRVAKHIRHYLKLRFNHVSRPRR